MIVDLLRNDLSRICLTGTVKATRLFDVERFPSVWQMTSTVEGELHDRCALEEILCALFPSGSVTGAPKIRSMQHIARLETWARGVYTGAIGYLAPGRAHFSVPIRTAILQEGKGVMGVGSGITHESSAAGEWEECAWKASFLTRRAPEFQLLETLLWDGDFVLLEEHLERLRDSATYFGFLLDENEIRRALLNFEVGMERKPKRVRVTVSRDGDVHVEAREQKAKRFGRVRLSEIRTFSMDVFLRHKTTYRTAYDRELAAATEAECDDALFFNEREELTEGAAHNIFLVLDGAWKTPPVSCGLLPGTYRGKFLRENPNAREEVLTRQDLSRAERIYLCNSVRGMYAVEFAGPAQGQSVFAVEPARRM